METPAKETPEAKTQAKLEAEKKAIADAENKRLEDEKAAAVRKAQEAKRAMVKDANHKEAIEFNAKVDQGQKLADEIETARQEELKPDKEKLRTFMDFIGEIPLPELSTDDGKRINQIIDASLSDLIFTINAEMSEV